VFVPYFFCRTLLSCVVRRRNVFAAYKQHRGMSIAYDWVDWLGGYPFEVARVEQVFGWARERGFWLVNIKTDCGLGNNQFVFVKRSEAPGG